MAAQKFPSVSSSIAKSAGELARLGRFRQALDTLRAARTGRRPSPDPLEPELLERCGELDAGRTAARRILGSSTATDGDRAVCELVLARVDWECGETEEAIAHVQRAIRRARDAHQLETLCWAEFTLFLILSDRPDPEPSVVLLSEIRSDVTRCGDPHVTAGLHITLAQVEAKRGWVGSSQKHIATAEQLLRTSPNVWLSALAENTGAAIALMRADYELACIRAKKAIDLAVEAGAAIAKRASLANLGIAHYQLGHYQTALDYVLAADHSIKSTSDNAAATLDTIAQIYLTTGRVDACGEVLDRIERSISVQADRSLYGFRYASLSKAKLARQQKLWPAALDAAYEARSLAEAVSDRLLQTLARLETAAIAVMCSQVVDSVDALDDVAADIHALPPDLQAHYAAIVSLTLKVTGADTAARLSFDRAARGYQLVNHVPGRRELDLLWAAADHDNDDAPPTPTANALTLLQSVAALLLHAGRPELLAHELVQLIADIGIARRATATARDPNGAVETLAALDCRGDRPAAAPQCFELGTARERHIAVVVEPYGDVVSRLALQAIRIVLATVRDLEVARAEREERVTLWPIDDIPLESGHAVVNGGMRDLIALAKKVAPANVAVLLTGESGTGKEVVARAIHSFSPRARQPFIPFNCAAVPREMLESQLFGHRRGAFTGADRDQPGVIRAAAGGTLFLDEIGEMGPDLQPKLLRFLESGEICPLGESTPFTVDVRIVAATNANIEDAVKAGRFREDLFYRLNVVRLRIPPLRERRDEIPALAHHFLSRAAEEFRKGQLRLSEETMEHLVLYPWPGNIRELNNEIRRMAALAEPDSVLQPGDMAETIRATIDSAARPLDPKTDIVVRVTEKLPAAVERIERAMIAAALERHGGRVDAAAKALGLSRKGLYLKRQRYGL